MDPNRRKAFEREALPHLDALYGMALRLTRNERDAEDLVQDSLVRAFRFYDRYEEGSNIKAWLFKILTNAFYNNVRKRKNLRRLESEAEVGGHYDRFISDASTLGRDAEKALMEKIAAEELSRAIEELPEEFRTAVLLCDVHDFSYRDIAEIIERPVGTVMSRLYRGRRLLQRKLYAYAVEQGYIKVPEAADGDDAGVGADAPASLDDYRKRRTTGRGGQR
ncbi:MAG: sigma-70 family RNA polymerase sigma factor [Myxococcales bacterium]|nr:sigma-70 family RNA polymerase sigma factor [Myxococcales bacterium]